MKHVGNYFFVTVASLLPDIVPHCSFRLYPATCYQFSHDGNWHRFHRQITSCDLSCLTVIQCLWLLVARNQGNIFSRQLLRTASPKPRSLLHRRRHRYKRDSPDCPVYEALSTRSV